MGWLINLAANVSNVQGLLDRINGYKTYIGAAAAILGGAATCLTAAAKMLGELMACHSAADYWHYAQALPHDPCLSVMTQGWLAISGGLVAVGLRHAHEKTVAALSALPQAAPTPSPTAAQ